MSLNWVVVLMGCRAGGMSRRWDIAQLKCRASEKSRKWDVTQMGCRAIEISRRRDIAQKKCRANDVKPSGTTPSPQYKNTRLLVNSASKAKATISEERIITMKLFLFLL